jgi:hypothetical protein
MTSQNFGPYASRAQMMMEELRPFRPKMSKIGMQLYLHPYGVHISSIIYAAIAVITLCCGYVCAMYFADPLLFARFGSLVVAYGIIFGVLGVDGTIKRDLRFFQFIYEAMREDEIAEAQKKDALKPEDVGNILLSSFQKSFAEKTFSDLSEKIIRHTWYVDAVILLAGTLVWGFGDLLIKTK